MAAIIPLFQLMRIDISIFSKQELFILEAELYIRIYEELKEVFRKQYKDYFHLMKLTKEKECSMLETDFISSIIQDILSTQEYTLQGIAEYTDFHEDIVVDVIAGKNVCPSSVFLKRIIELHRSVRSDLYKEIMKKIAVQYIQ